MTNQRMLVVLQVDQLLASGPGFLFRSYLQKVKLLRLPILQLKLFQRHLERAA